MAQQANYSTVYEEDPLAQAIRDYIATNPTPAELAAAMAQYGVSADQISSATGYTVEQVNNYVAPAVQAPEPVAPEPEPAPEPDMSAYWAEQARLQQAEWERQAAAQQAEWERQAAAQRAADEAAAARAAEATRAAEAARVAQIQADADRLRAQQVAAPVAPTAPTAPVQQVTAPVAPVQEAAPPPPQAQASAPAGTTTTTVTPPTVAQVTAAIDKWTADNPGATTQQLAVAIKNGMGLTPEVTQALANKYNMSTTDVTAAYNDLITRPPEVLPPTVAQVSAAIDKWSSDNPGATPAQLATAIKNGMGMTDTVAQALATKYNMPAADVVKSYNDLITQPPPTTGPVAPTTTETKDPYAGVEVKDYRGQSYSASDLIRLATQVAQNLDVSKSSGGAFGTKGENIGFDYGTLTSAFGGKSFTAGDQVAFDIARQLLDQGITNYDQIKNAKKTTITEQQVTGSGEDQQVYDVQREVYVDPKTGKQINTDIGSTYTGKGNTQYHIDPTTGKFYTTAESSSDVSPEMMMALSIGASFLMPGVGEILAAELGVSAATGTALANAGLQLAMGADPKTVLLNAGLAVSGVTKGAGNFVQTGLENLTSGLPEGLVTEKMLSTAAAAITRAGTTFLTTGDTSTALTAAAGSVVNDVVTDKTGSNVLGAGAAAYIQTGDLTTAGLVAANAAAFNAGQTYKKDVVDLFTGAKNSVLQTITADNLAGSGITQAALDDLFDPAKNPYLTSTDITQLAATNNTGVVTDAGAGTNDNRVEGAWSAGPNGQRRWVEVKGADGTTKYAGWETVGEDGQIYGTITSGGVDKDGNPTDVYVTGLRGGIPINVDVTKSDTAGAFSVKAVKPTDFTLGGTTANATPNVLSQSNAVSTTNNTTSAPGNIQVPGGNTAGTSGSNVLNISGIGSNTGNAIINGTGGNTGNVVIGGTGGNTGNVVIGGTGGNTGNVTITGGTGGNTGNVVIGNTVGNTGNVTITGNTAANTTSNVSTIGNVISTIGNIISDGNVITVLNTPNTTPNVSTPITTTLGTAITPMKFASGGLNPGWIAPTPFYTTTSPAQSKFYWGQHSYQTGPTFDPVAWNTVAGAPAQPWGAQAINQPLTSAEIAAIVANPGSNNAQQTTQAASSFVPAQSVQMPVTTPITVAPAPVQQLVAQPITVPAPVAPPAQAAPQPVVQPAPVTPPGQTFKLPEMEVQPGMPITPPDNLVNPGIEGPPIFVDIPERWRRTISPPLPLPIAGPIESGPIQQPVAPPRDTRYAGMPDDMYNNMMAHQQNMAEQMARYGYAADTADIKPWDMWMANQQGPVSMPVAPVAPAPSLADWQEPTLPTGFRYAGGDEIDSGTAIYSPDLNHYIMPLAPTAGPVAP